MARAGVRNATIGLVVAISVALAAAGCGVQQGRETSSVDAPARVEAGSFEGAGGAAFLSRAATSTSKVRTERVDMTVTSSGGPIAVSTHATGEFDNERRRGHLTMDLGDTFGGFAGGADHGQGAGNATIETVLDGTTVYLRSPLLRGLTGAGTPWIKVEAKGQELPSELGVSQADPGAFLTFLEGAGGTLTTVGREKLRSIDTTHVKTTLDYEKLLAQAPAAKRELLERQLRSLGLASADLPDLPAEAWVDDDGYVRKFQLSMPAGAVARTPKLDDLSVTVTIELYDFDEPVDISIPPASQVSTIDPKHLGGN
ncbi:MAG: hypothetical protein JWM89_3714 [Acidimicrobiales bacterium]|nr:hypothetical protein [Acidimicrobiales bacterium]